ncbi:MAG: hypothetical protein H8E14_14510 [Candidatus Marinimicrobia bacterium]|nr:hypothetical protein [Candidatus Neomarinimicrobiota bacterium]
MSPNKLSAKSNQIIKRLIWDYNIKPEAVYQVLIGERERVNHWDFEHIFLRSLERLGWYDLLNLLGEKRLKDKLTPDIIKQLRNPELRTKYERLYKILHQEPVSFAGWGAELRKQFQHTLFSDRWYRS